MVLNKTVLLQGYLPSRAGHARHHRQSRSLDHGQVHGCCATVRQRGFGHHAACPRLVSKVCSPRRKLAWLTCSAELVVVSGLVNSSAYVDTTRKAFCSCMRYTGLFLGGLQSFAQLADMAITHFVTILPSLSALQDSPELQPGLDPKYQRLHIKLEDLDHANLLLHMDAAIEYIQAAIAGGNVLVHCAAGISRSSTVIIAYLMATEGLPRDKALDSLRESAPWVQPNPGFMHQLDLFAEMECSLKPDYPPYQALLQSQHRQLITLNARPLPKVYQGEAWLCKQCSFLLVTHDRVVCLQKPEACPSNTSPESVPSPAQLQPCIVPDESTHAAGMHPDAFIARQPGNATQGVLLIKPQRWMSQLQSGDHSHSDDVLLCPRCKLHVGDFLWRDEAVKGASGLQCSDGMLYAVPQLFLSCLTSSRNSLK